MGNSEKTLYDGEHINVTLLDVKGHQYIIYFESAADGEISIGDFNVFGKRRNTPHGLFSRHGINEIFVRCKYVLWYQTPEIERAIKIIKTVIAGHESHTVAYGTSMGGFAAINYSAELAIRFVAFVPQISLAAPYPIKASWQAIFETLPDYPTFHSRILDGECKKSEGLIFCDVQYKRDYIHAQAIKKCTNAKIINIPFSLHGTSIIVNDNYRIHRLMKEYINDDFNVSSFKREFFSRYNMLNAFARKAAAKYVSHDDKTARAKVYTLLQNHPTSAHYILAKQYFTRKNYSLSSKYFFFALTSEDITSSFERAAFCLPYVKNKLGLTDEALYLKAEQPR